MDDHNEEIAEAMRAIVALLSANRDEASESRPEVARSEAVLSRAGFSYQVIAWLTGKKPEAVRSFLRRQKAE